MPIQFEAERWDRIREIYGRWWNGTLDRPVVPVVLTGCDPGRPMPEAPLLSQETSLDLSWSPEALVDRIDYELSCRRYLGDAYPHFGLDCFGPGVLAAFLGIEPDNSSGRIWFSEAMPRDLDDFEFAFDPDNRWFRRIRDLCRAAADRWEGGVVLSMPDLGGTLDVLASFRGTENLLLDLYDQPQAVRRLLGRVHELWLVCFQEIAAVLAPTAKGFTDWSGIFSDRPSYVLQCDFAYMLGPGMFEAFVAEDLADHAARMANAIYHLDGPGQLRHLDAILSMKDIKAVQWIPGAGSPPQSEWPDVFRRIHAAGKGIQLIDGFECIDAVATTIGTHRGLLHWDITGPVSEEQGFRARLERIGVPA